MKHINRMTKPSAQRGFLLGYVLLGIVLISVVIAAIARANSSTASPQGGTEANKMYANTIIKIGNDKHDAAIRYAADRDINAMTLDTTAGTGLYDPALGLSVDVKVPAKATAAGGSNDVAVTYDKTGIVVTGMGTAAAEPSVTVIGLSDGVCRAINNVLFGDSVVLAIPSAVGTRQEGCATLGTPASNAYYKVIQPG